MPASPQSASQRHCRAHRPMSAGPAASSPSGTQPHTPCSLSFEHCGKVPRRQYALQTPTPAVSSSRQNPSAHVLFPLGSQVEPRPMPPPLATREHRLVCPSHTVPSGHWSLPLHVGRHTRPALTPSTNSRGQQATSARLPQALTSPRVQPGAQWSVVTSPGTRGTHTPSPSGAQSLSPVHPCVQNPPGATKSPSAVLPASRHVRPAGHGAEVPQVSPSGPNVSGVPLSTRVRPGLAGPVSLQPTNAASKKPQKYRGTESRSAPRWLRVQQAIRSGLAGARVWCKHRDVA